MVKNKKNILSLSILGIVLVVLCLLSIRFGSAKMTSGEFLLSLSDFRMKTPQGIILYSIRLPRMLGAVVAGMGLGMSGAILQTVTGNRMASPNLAGVNSGAGFGVIVCLSLFPNLFVFVPVFAFAGAFISTLVIAAISKKIGMTKGTLILVGLAFSSILSAGISLISLIDTDALVSYNFFSIGSLSGVKIQELIFPAFTVVVCLVASLIISRASLLEFLIATFPSSAYFFAVLAISLLLSSVNAGTFNLTKFPSLIGVIPILLALSAETIALISFLS